MEIGYRFVLRELLEWLDLRQQAIFIPEGKQDKDC